MNLKEALELEVGDILVPIAGASIADETLLGILERNAGRASVLEVDHDDAENMPIGVEDPTDSSIIWWIEDNAWEQLEKLEEVGNCSNCDRVNCQAPGICKDTKAVPLSSANPDGLACAKRPAVLAQDKNGVELPVMSRAIFTGDRSFDYLTTGDQPYSRHLGKHGVVTESSRDAATAEHGGWVCIEFDDGCTESFYSFRVELEAKSTVSPAEGDCSNCDCVTSDQCVKQCERQVATQTIPLAVENCGEPACNQGCSYLLAEPSIADPLGMRCSFREDITCKPESYVDHVVATDYPDNNPKSTIGASKAPLHLVPASAIIGIAVALSDGEIKYGYFNYRNTKISAKVYMAAVLRHLYAYFDGEETAADSGIHHLDHALAGLAIWKDSIVNGNVIDDRPYKGAAARLLKEIEEANREDVQNEAAQDALPTNVPGSTWAGIDSTVASHTHVIVGAPDVSTL